MATSVSQLLRSRYSIDAWPGAKVACPFCNHRTLSIAQDDLLAKCFHPGCGEMIQLASRGRYLAMVADVLAAIFTDFHGELLAQRDQPEKNAYHYAVGERGVHPQLIEESMLGAVPDGYNLDAKFDPLIRELDQEIEKAAKDADGKKKPKKKGKEETPEELRDRVVRVRDKLKKCVGGSRGWLCFFYVDALGRIVAIRFRKPYSKKILYFKPFDTAGVFGHTQLPVSKPEDAAAIFAHLIIAEGEFNHLQLQSLRRYYYDVTGYEPTEVASCAVGGVTNADYQTIKRIDPQPIICFDNDASGAGFALVERARQFMSVRAFTTPEPDSDLDSFIRSFGEDTQAAWEAVMGLLTGAEFHPRAYEGVAAQIFAIRQNPSLREFEMHADVAQVIIDDLDGRGVLYHDTTRAYFFDRSEKKLVEVSAGGIAFSLILAKYGLNATEKIHKYIVEAVRMEALQHGVRTDVRRMAHYNPETFTLYVFNHDSQIYRITPNSIDFIDNGTDGVLFLADPKATPFQLVARDESRSWLDDLIITKINFASDILSVDERRLVFAFWFLSLFFESIMPTKPIVAFIGEKGSGKSMTIRRVGILLLGEGFDVMPLSNDPKDFDAAVTNSAFVGIDNADAKSPWLEDRLAIVATGGSIKKRELYTTNTLVEFPARCNLAITSRTPHFRRDDVADRLLIMRVDRLATFKSERSLLAEVMEHRNEIMTEVIYHLQDVVRALRDAKDHDFSGAFRMADFADFAMKIARHAGIENQLEAIFQKLSHEQSVFTLEGDEIFDLLQQWVAINGNAGREVTNTELCRELAKVAEDQGITFIYEGKTRAFAQRMTNLRPNLMEFFDIIERKAGGHRTCFRFQLKEEK